MDGGNREKFRLLSCIRNGSKPVRAIPAKGGADEARTQHEVLSKWNKEATEPKPEDLAVVPMVYPAP